MNQNNEIKDKVDRIEVIINKTVKRLYLDVIYEFVKQHKFLGIPIISIVIPLILHFLYGVGYMFLYGFYFGGTTNKSPSLLEMFVFPIPFEFYSVMIISIILVIGVILLIIITNQLLRIINFSSTFSGLKGRTIYKMDQIFLFFVTFILFHISLSMIFLGGIEEFGRSMLFIMVWTGPFTIAMVAVWLSGFKKSIIVNIIELCASFIFCVCMVSILTTLFKNLPLFDYWKLGLESDIIIILSTLLIALILREHRLFFFDTSASGYIYRIIIFNSCSFFILLILSNIFRVEFGGVIYFLTILLSIFIASFLPFLNFIGFSFYKKAKAIEAKKNSGFQLIKLPLIIITSCVILTNFSVQSFEAGRYLRKTIIKVSGHKVEKNYLVETIFYSNENECLNGFIVTADKNGVYYISNEEWKLVTLKNVSIRTQPLSNNTGNLRCRNSNP